MTDAGYEYFYGWVLLWGWVIIPTAINLFFFTLFVRASNERMAHQAALDERKYHVKWKKRWNGAPYIADEGWGLKYSKLSEDEYFEKLYSEKRNETKNYSKLNND